MKLHLSKGKFEWKKILNAESKSSHWEITHHIKEKKVVLHYVPEDDYSINDVRIKMSYHEFKDLLDFIKLIE